MEKNWAHFSLDWLFIFRSPFFSTPFLPVLLSTLFPPSEVRVTRSCHEALMEHESTGYRKNNPSKIPRRGTPYTKIARATGHAHSRISIRCTSSNYGRNRARLGKNSLSSFIYVSSVSLPPCSPLKILRAYRHVAYWGVELFPLNIALFKPWWKLLYHACYIVENCKSSIEELIVTKIVRLFNKYMYLNDDEEWWKEKMIFRVDIKWI